MTFGLRVKAKRKEHHITQDRLAVLTGLNINSIKKLETNRVMPSIETLEKLCILFKCTADHLLGWDSGNVPSPIDEIKLNPYAQMLKDSIEKSGLTMTEIAQRLSNDGKNIHASYIGKLASGNREPATDETNQSLAEFLNMDALKFRTLAWLDKIPSDVLKNIMEGD